jgi:hypothetical protein
MLKNILILMSIFLLLASTALPQGRGGQGQGKGQGMGSGQGQGMGGGQGQGIGQGAGQGQGSAQSGDMQRDQKRVRATTQQRDQIRECDKLADGVRKQARAMSQSGGKKFNAENAKKQNSQIREQVRTMEQEHERLMNGLDSSQQQAWQEQIRNMNQSRQQMNTRLQQMAQDLGSPDPDPKRVSENAREMENAMNKWRDQYRILASQAEL